MISIEVKNASEVIRSQKGWFVSKALDLFGMSEVAVEKIVADKLKLVLKEQGIEVVVKVFPKALDN